jgi:hypothetical protein
MGALRVYRRTGHAEARALASGGHGACCAVSNGSRRATTWAMAAPLRTSSLAPVVVLPHTAEGGNQRTRKRARRGTLANERGVWLVPQQVGGRTITKAELAEAQRAVRALPAADVALLARADIRIHLLPVAGLEDGLLGATTIVQEAAGAPWQPTKIRVAARAGLDGQQSIGEIVQHEVGHAIAVLRGQDRSEDAATTYALRY